MYQGVTAHRNVPRVVDYESAVKAQRAGTMRSKVAGIHEYSDEIGRASCRERV